MDDDDDDEEEEATQHTGPSSQAIDTHGSPCGSLVRPFYHSSEQGEKRRRVEGEGGGMVAVQVEQSPVREPLPRRAYHQCRYRGTSGVSSSEAFSLCVGVAVLRRERSCPCPTFSSDTAASGLDRVGKQGGVTYLWVS